MLTGLLGQSQGSAVPKDVRHRRFQCGSRQACSDLCCEPRGPKRDMPVSLVTSWTERDFLREVSVVESEHEIRIARSPEAAFDFFADLRNEPEWNHGHVRDVRMTSAPPIGQGTTFEGRHPGFGTATWRLVEYERPRHLVIEGFVGKAPYRYVGDFESVDGGTLFRGRVEWEPRGIWRALGPLLHPLLRFRVRRSFDNLRIALEKERHQHDG